MNTSSEDIRHYGACRICSSSSIEVVMELVPTPPADLFLPVHIAPKSYQTYPLSLALCLNCGYLHLPWVLRPDRIYPDFRYTTLSTVGLRDHYLNYSEEILQAQSIKSNDLIVDIGSNDGTFLKTFKSLGARLVGVEPSTLIPSQETSGLKTISAFFDDQVLSHILQTEGRAKLVTSNYTYANVEDVLNFTKNVQALLQDDGLFVVQTGYHPDQMKLCMFDYIYHEHLSYFSVSMLKTIFKKYGLELIYVTRNSMKGGSIRLISQKIGGCRKIDPSVREFLLEEEKFGVNKIETYTNFNKFVSEKNIELIAMLDRVKSAKCKIVGYGASHSTTTLLHHFNLSKYVDYIVDDNLSKQGTVSPGYRIPVQAPSMIYKTNPEYVLILAWQHATSIIRRNNKYSEAGGKFIMPLPIAKVC